MGRRKKFRRPQNLTFTLEHNHARELRLMAARQEKSLSALIRYVVLDWLAKLKQNEEDLNRSE